MSCTVSPRRNRLRILAALLLAAALAPGADAQTACPLPNLEHVAANHPQCLFYIGTAAYRRQEFGKAAEAWQRLARLDTPKDLARWRNEAVNNLGFLYYRGWGVTADRTRALQLWTEAYEAGHDEAAYHLCHFYGERKEPEFQPALALDYCREALRRYEQIRQPEGEDREVMRQLRQYVRKLGS